jgi:rhodanese-related sulfurtransferase
MNIRVHCPRQKLECKHMPNLSNSKRPGKSHGAKVRRRQLFGWGGGLAVMVFTSSTATLVSGASAVHAETGTISAEDAHKAALAGDVILLDIRTPQEWAETGVPASGHPVSMHVPGFLDELSTLNEGDRNRPVALICARGNRSAFLKSELEKRGFTNIIDVSEGMVGGQRGAGWIARGLPTTKLQDAPSN